MDKTRRIIERPKGVGVLKKDGKHIADVQYSLMVVQEYEKVDELHEVEGQGEITGQFTIVSGDVGNIFYDVFTLELQDGRILGVNAMLENGKNFSITVNDASKFQLNSPQ